MKDLKWEHEVLEQRFSKVQVERDDLYKKFTQAIQEVQQKSGFMNLLLERKLGALTNTLEKKEAQLNALVVVTRKLEEMASWNPKATDWSAPSLARPLTPLSLGETAPITNSFSGLVSFVRRELIFMSCVDFCGGQ